MAQKNFIITHRTEDGVFISTEVIQANDLDHATFMAKRRVPSGVFSVHMDKATGSEIPAMGRSEQMLVNDLFEVSPELAQWALRKVEAGETAQAIRAHLLKLALASGRE